MGRGEQGLLDGRGVHGLEDRAHGEKNVSFIHRQQSFADGRGYLGVEEKKVAERAREQPLPSLIAGDEHVKSHCLSFEKNLQNCLKDAQG